VRNCQEHSVLAARAGGCSFFVDTRIAGSVALFALNLGKPIFGVEEWLTYKLVFLAS
jgi:hypothetical protein